MGILRRSQSGEGEEEDTSEEEKENEKKALTSGVPPGTGIFGVLEPNAPKKSPNAGHAAPQMKIELLERKTTGSMFVSIWVAFLITIAYFVTSSSTKTARFKLPPPATAAAIYGAPAADLVGVANYLPYTDAAGENVFDFRAAVTVLPPDISVTGNEGANVTALQWFGTNLAGVTTDYGSTWIWFVEYRDDNGIQLSGEKIRLEILAYVCWADCDNTENWHAIFTDETSPFDRDIEIRETNALGEPTVIRWDIVAYSEYTPSHENVCFGIRYLNDPGDATAGYKVFEENTYGQFGSCGSGDADSCDSSDSSYLNPDDSCMQITQKSLINEDFTRKGLALGCFVLTLLCTIAWVFSVYRAPPRGWHFWNIQQKWTFVMSIGTLLYQNPVQTIYLFYDSLEDKPQINRTMESITVAGMVIVLLVAVFWADSARYRVMSPGRFYVPKIAYAVTTFATVYAGLLAVYPTGEGSTGDFWAASAWSWPEDRSKLFVVAEALRLTLWLLAGFFYYYYLHCSFKFYNKVPYMLTRAEQLSFRFVVSTFSLFVMLAVLSVAARFAIAVGVTIKAGDRETSLSIQSSAFFKFMYGESIRSPVTMAFMSVAVLVFQFAFMPASAMQLSKYKPKYVRLESDILRQAWRRRRGRSYQRQGNTLKPAAGAGAAAAANVSDGAAAVGHAANVAAHGVASKAATATAAATGGTVDVVNVVAATPERPLFVIERARWLAGISREAYRCYSEEEVVLRSEKAPNRLVDVAPLGCEIVAKLSEPEDHNLHDTHCLIVRHKVTRRLIVAFRGTVSKKQMKTFVQGWKASINLDLFVMRAEKKSWFRFNGQPTAEQSSFKRQQSPAAAAGVPNGQRSQQPQQPLPPQGAVAISMSELGSSSQAPSRGLQGSAASVARRAERREKLRAHMATEENMPHFLMHLASVLQIDVETAGRSMAEIARAEALSAKSSIASAAAAGHGAPGSSTSNEARSAAVNAGDREYDVATPLEEGRGPSLAEPGTEEEEDARGSVAATAKAATGAVAQPAVRAGTAAAAAVGGAAGALREKAAAMHAKRLAAQHARMSRGRIHHGFWSSYSTVRERVMAIVQRELLQEPGQLYVTGHSLGGALGTLCAYDLSLWLLPVVNARLGRGPDSTGEEHDEEIKCTMYNFGSPRVGDFFFAKRYNSVVPHSYRVVCDGDFITGMPPKLFGYTHVGCMAVIDRTGCGSLLIDPSVLEARFKTSRTLNVAAHLFGPYMAALDGCLYPLETKEEIVALTNAVYRNRSGGEWYGCACFWLCCDARLPRWLGCDSCGKGATGAVGEQEGESDTDRDADDMDTLEKTSRGATVTLRQKQAAGLAAAPRAPPEGSLA